MSFWRKRRRNGNSPRPASESFVPVNHHTSVWACFNALPVELQEQATKQHELFLENPFHPSLRLKQIDVFWSVRIGRSHGALATREGDLFAWFWIGPHDEYERILKETRLACDRAFRSGRQPL